MENATKALLIAAAVLVAILVISLGLVIYNKASEAGSDADLTEYQIQAFNEQFLKFEGTNISGSDIRAMVKTVYNHNLAQASNATCVTVAVSYEDAFFGLEDSNDINSLSIPSEILPTMKFNVKCGISRDTKLVNVIVAKDISKGDFEI